MNFRTNLNVTTLFSGDIIKIFFEGKTIEFVPPNLHYYLNDIEFQEFMFLLKQALEIFKENGWDKQFVVENRYEALLAILKLNFKSEPILEYFKMLFPNITYENQIFICNDTDLISEEYEILLQILLISCSEEELEPFLKQMGQKDTSESSTIKKLMAEQEEKINKAKKKNKKSSAKSKITYDQIIIGILYEFPSLTLDRIYDMNMFTLIQFWSYISKVVDTQIQVVAAGNGLTKEFTYFI